VLNLFGVENEGKSKGERRKDIMKKIELFRNEFGWLSNFWKVEIWYGGKRWSSVEHLFQACKTLDYEEREKMRLMGSPGDVKRYARKLALRPDWEKIKLDVMRECIRRKFLNPELRVKLLNLKGYELVEGNNWGDKYWGVCNGVGENWLGKILMSERDKI